MMKRKELLKRGLAAMLSATMAFSLAPDVGFFSVPANVMAEDYDGTKATISVASGVKLTLASKTGGNAVTYGAGRYFIKESGGAGNIKLTLSTENAGEKVEYFIAGTATTAADASAQDTADDSDAGSGTSINITSLNIAADSENTIYYAYKLSTGNWTTGNFVLVNDTTNPTAPTATVPESAPTNATPDSGDSYSRMAGSSVSFSYTEKWVKSQKYTVEKVTGFDGNSVNYTKETVKSGDYNGTITLPETNGLYAVTLTIKDYANQTATKTIYVRAYEENTLAVSQNGTKTYNGSEIDPEEDLIISGNNEETAITYKYIEKAKANTAKDADYTTGLPSDRGTYHIKAAQVIRTYETNGKTPEYILAGSSEFDATIGMGDLSKNDDAFILGGGSGTNRSRSFNKASSQSAASLTVTLNAKYALPGKSDVKSLCTYKKINSDGSETAIAENPGTELGKYAVYVTLTENELDPNYETGTFKAGEFSVVGGDLNAIITTQIQDADTGTAVTGVVTPKIGDKLKAVVTGFPSDATIKYTWTVGVTEQTETSDTFIVPKGSVGSAIKVYVSDASESYTSTDADYNHSSPNKSTSETTGNAVAKPLGKVTGITVSAKMFDGTAVAKVTDVTFAESLVEGDTAADILDLDTMNASGTAYGAYADAKVGKDKAVTFTNNKLKLKAGVTDYDITTASAQSDLASLGIKGEITQYVPEDDPISIIENVSVSAIEKGIDGTSGATPGDTTDDYTLNLSDPAVKFVTLTNHDIPTAPVNFVTSIGTDVTNNAGGNYNYKVEVIEGKDLLDTVPYIADSTSNPTTVNKIPIANLNTAYLNVDFKDSAVKALGDKLGVIKLGLYTDSSVHTNFVLSGVLTINITNKKVAIIDSSAINSEEYGVENDLDFDILDENGSSIKTMLDDNAVIEAVVEDENGEDVTEAAKKGTLKVGDTYTLSATVSDTNYFGVAEVPYEVTKSTHTLKAADFVAFDGEEYELGDTEIVPTAALNLTTEGGAALDLGEGEATLTFIPAETSYGANGVEFADITEIGDYDVYVSTTAGNYAALPESVDTKLGLIKVIEPVTRYNVDYYIDGEDEPFKTDRVDEGGVASEPTDLGRVGVEVVGWYEVVGYEDGKFVLADETYDFSKVLTGDLVLVAKVKPVTDESAAKAAEKAAAYIEAAGVLPQTKDAITDAAATETAIAAAEALKPTDEQVALLDADTKAKVEEATGKIATAKAALEEAKKGNEGQQGGGSNEGSGSGTDTTTGSSTDVTPSGSGSGSSGGGGGSSNAKTVKNADGSTTTTTTTAKGTIETTTKTNADGSKTTSKVVKNKDGSGSVTETSVSAAGTTKVVEVVTDTTGAATEVTTTVSNSKGASMKVTYAAKGTAITVSKVETTGKTAVSIPATVKVGGKTYKVTKIAASALKGNKEITKVTLGKNVKSIGKNAFNGDSKLKTIVMKKAPTTVGKNAFKGIAKKATIKIKATKKAFKTAKKLIKKSGVASTVKIKRA